MKAISLAIALIGISTVAQADLRSEIDSMSKVIAKEMRTKDFKALDKTMRAGMTKDFTYEENGQKQTYDQMFGNMKAGLGMMKKLTEVDSKIVSLKQKGNIATCEQTHSMTGITTGEDKKTHTMTFTGVSEDTFVKVGGQWKMSKMVWKSNKMTRDGKPMPAGR